jgi:hypothetical protein
MERCFALCVGALVALAGCGGDVSVGNPGGAGGTGGDGGTSHSTYQTYPTSGTGAGGTTGTSGTTGTVADFALCTGAGQCAMAIPGCCSPCGIPEAESFVGVNTSHLDEFAELVCPEPQPCPECATGLNPHLFAACQPDVTCNVFDVRTHDVSLCTSDADCFLRVGTGCCEPCDASSVFQLTAVSGTANLSLDALVCNPLFECPPCAPQYPPEAFAYCGADGHCAVGTVMP